MPDDHPAPAQAGTERVVLLAGVVLLLVLTAVQVLPAAGRLATHVVPNDGDSVLVTWILEHQARALLDDPGAIYRGNIFFPEPSAIAWSDNLTAFVPPYLLVWLGTGRSSTLAYNVVTFLTFAGSALAVLVLARRLLRAPAAAVVVAVAFTVACVRTSAVGHTQLGGFLFLALLLVLLMDLVERRRLGTALLGGLCLAGLWYSAIYYFVLAVVVVPAFVLVWAGGHRRAIDRRLVGRLACLAVVGGLLVAPSLPPYLDLQERASFERSDEELLTIGAASFTRPPSVLYRAIDEPEDPSEGSDGFLGWTAMALAAVGLALAAVSTARRRGRGDIDAATVVAARRWTVEERRRQLGPALAAACVVAALLSLGPDDGWLSAPYRALRPLVPGLESARALNRFWALPALGVALLAGYAVDRLTARRRPWAAPTVATVAVALLVVEMLVRPGSSLVDAGPELVAVNEALSRLPEGVVTELPVPTSPEYAYVLAARQLRSLEDGYPRVEGYSGDAPPGMAEYLEATSTFPAPEALVALRQAGVRHVVMHGAASPCVGRFGEAELRSLLDAARRSPEVEAVTTVGSSAVVTLVPSGRRGPLDALPSVTPLARTSTSCERN